jgi:formylglycine-generating enzyme
MKKLLSVLLVAGLLAGCGDDESETPIDSNETKGGPSNVEPTEGKPFTVSDLSMEMLWCPPGTFMMGSPESEKGRDDDETQHTVTLTQGYWLGKYEATQAQWEAVMGTNPSEFKGENLPVETVSWDEVTSFCAKLTERERKAGRLPEGYAYQLPTEAQWEYACRAGTRTAYSFGDTANLLYRHANYADKNTNVGWSDKLHDDGHANTAPVGSYPANAWGFHDMHGNVREWCSDYYGIYPTGTVTDPTGPASGSDRATRGSSWDSVDHGLRSAKRLSQISDARSKGIVPPNPIRRLTRIPIPIPRGGGFTLGFRVALSENSR